MKKTFIIIILFVICAVARAQSRRLDSLLAKIQQIDDTSRRDKLLTEISGIQGGDAVLLKRGEAVLAKADGNNKKQERALRMICDAYFELHDSPALLQTSLKGIRLSRSANDKFYLSEFFHAAAMAYRYAGDTHKSASYSLQAADAALRTGATIQAIINFSNLESDYAILKMPDSALNYAKLERKLTATLKSTDKIMMYGLSGSDMAEAFATANRPDSALKYYRRVYDLAKKINLQAETFPYMLNNMAETFLKLNQADSALKYARESYNQASKTRQWDYIYNAAEILEKIYEGKADKKSLFYLKAEMAAQDSINANDASRRFQLVNDKEQQRLQELKTVQERFEARVRLAIVVGTAIILLVIGIILGRHNRKQKRSNRMLSEQKEEISAQRDELEGKNRDLEIEEALERVRTVAMGMGKAEDLLSICETMFHELEKLGFGDLRNAMINIHYNEKKYLLNYEHRESVGKTVIKVLYNSHPIVNNLVNHAKQSGEGFTEQVYAGETLEEWKAFRKRNGEADDPRLDNISGLYYYYFYSIGTGSVGVSMFSAANSWQLEVLKRFRNVFDLAYKRYIDITNAAAQAREAQIELGLERVRARAMAMQQSEELSELVALLITELSKLDMALSWCLITILDEATWSAQVWRANSQTDQAPQSYYLPFADHPFQQAIMQAWKERQEKWSYVLTGDEKKAMDDYMFNKTDYSKLPQQVQAGIRAADPAYFYFSFGNFGGLQVGGPNQLTDESLNILARFGKVFDLTYTRFNDLKQAEAQARESQIQLALERVRARTMAMQKSEELHEVIQLVFDQLLQLNFNIDNANFALNYQETDDLDLWIAATTGAQYATKIYIPYFKHPMFDRYNKAKGKVGLYTDTLSQEEKNSFFAHFFKYVPKVTDERKAWIFDQPGLARSIVFMKDTALTILNYQRIPYAEAENNTLLRFGQVFNETYTRFNDLKQAEEQAREAQIEVALERVRSRSMAMQHSNELKEVIQVVFDQFVHLDIGIDHTGFVVDYEPGADWHFWIADHIGSPNKLTVGYFDSVWGKDFNEAKKNGTDFFVTNLDIEAKNKFYRDMFEHFPEMPQEYRDNIFSKAGLAASTVLQESVALYIENFSGTPYTNEENAILMRFGKVFQQTYTRFLDLQKAEAQAREAKIELGLERVRARAMAMQNSAELAGLVGTIFNELTKLDFSLTRCAIYIMDENLSSFRAWRANTEIDQAPESFYIKFNNHPYFNAFFKAWKERKLKWVYDLKGIEKQSLDDYWFNETEYSRLPDIVQAGMREPEQVFLSYTFNNFGGLQTAGLEPLSDANLDILSRFGKVFDLTYTRFNDLQQAEAQTRESHIQLGLERVRAAAMAMHNSKDVGNATALVFGEFYKLGITTLRCGVCIIDGVAKQMEVWTANSSADGVVSMGAGKLSMTGHPLWLYLLNAWQQKISSFSYELAGQELTDYYNAITHSASYHLSEDAQLGQYFDTKQYCNCYLFNEGCLFTFTEAPFSPEANQILERFAAVFGLTYRRYLDLQKAEAQAREAQIEAALERVRSRTMGMQKSGELAEVIQLIYEQLIGLNFNIGTALFEVNDQASNDVRLWLASPNQTYPASIFVPYFDHPIFNNRLAATVHGSDHFVTKLTLDEKNQWLNHFLKNSSPLPDLPPEVLDRLYKTPALYAYGILMKTITLTISNWEGDAYTEAEQAVVMRFGKVFEQTYTRFLDLQKAEIQAREAVKQASLDRVRGEIASMRTVKDLERIIPLVWNELTILGIPFIRCGVFIVDEAAALIHTHLSTPDGKAIAAFALPFNAEGIGRDMLPAWRNKQMAAIHWSAKEFAANTEMLVSQGTVKRREKYVTERPDTTLDLHFFPFLQGMLYVGSTAPLNTDDKDLVQSLADAFSTAYARYEDFNRLEAAKQEVDNTLAQLKAAQTQLIQSEKMASLGELTAGIAHEIQNPLNFVNNFSEVNQEMIDELAEELNAGNIEEALALAADIKQNEEKIRHHGKRADGIVKGMLEHSRASSAQKEPTDLNKLADEYLRLAYHGLRAKNKSFNAELVTKFDENLPKANIIPQDIGRVMLNLFNNAFYAVNQKLKTAVTGYKPEVTVSTAVENDRAFITVKDNGNGIPDAIKDKIMQPFFTTKPTGDGTGLGLSLSYDIVVKGHRGTIKVESEEGLGCEFIINLPIS